MGAHGNVPAWKRWVLTTDHKKIGILYLWTSAVFFLLGGIAALIVRTELWSTGRTIVDPGFFYNMFSLHGTTMIFFFIIPIMAAFGNYFLPLLIGAPDMAYPRLNALSYWTYLSAGMLLYTGVIIGFLPGIEFGETVAAVGWTAYPPLAGVAGSQIGSAGAPGVDLWITAIHLVGISSMMGAVNFIVTTLKMRKPGIHFHNMSLFVWAQFITAVLITFATPMIGNAILMNFLDRNLGTLFFVASGDPVLYQHLFWFYSHPAVYVMILPAMGIISEIIPRMVDRPIFGYHAMAYSISAIGFLGFTVWAHHMFTTGIDPRIRAGFMFTTMIIGVPTGVKMFNWIATIWGGRTNTKLPFLWCLGFLAMFVIGGVDGIFMASIPVDYQLHDTYWVVSHIHYVLFGGSVLGVFAGLYYWWPRMFGRVLDRKLGLAHFWTTLIGMNLVFMTMHLVGLAGMPRRVYDYLEAFQFMNQLATIGAWVLALGQLFFVWAIWRSFREEPTVEDDPWLDVSPIEWDTFEPPREPSPAGVAAEAEA